MIFNKKRTFSLYKVLNNLLQSLSIKVTETTLKQIIDEKDIYNGSIIGISEMLLDLEIESKIFRVKYSDLLDLEYPILAHMEQEVPYYIVITGCTDEKLTYFDSSNGYITESAKDFCKKWTGVILVPITSINSGDPELQEKIKKESISRRLKILFFSIIALYVVFIVFRTSLIFKTHYIIWTPFIIVQLLGTIFSLLIVRIEFGESNLLIRKICRNFDCEKVLLSNGSKIFSWLSMGDIGVIYFSGGLLLLSTHTSEIYTSLKILWMLNVITLPYTIYSIFYQYKIVNAYCPFCLTIIVLIWFEFISGLYAGFRISFVELPLILDFLINYLIIIIIWIGFRNFYSKALKGDRYEKTISRIKKDKEFFYAILATRTPVPEFFQNNEISIGEKTAPHTLIAVITPNCNSCFQLYSDIKSYTQEFPNRLRIIFRFKGIDSVKSDMNKIIDWILTFHILGDTSRALDIYESWIDMKFNGIKKWEEKNLLTDKTIIFQATQIRLDYSNWFNLIDIPGVPVLILDNKIIPIYYDFNDLKYLLKHSI